MRHVAIVGSGPAGSYTAETLQKADEIAIDVIDRVPHLGSRAAYAKQAIRDNLIEHREYIAKHGEDLPEVLNWSWAGREAG